MKKGIKIVAIILLLLGIGSIGMYFVFSHQTYKVLFDTDGGSIITAQEVEKDKLVIKPNDPIKEGSEFVNWLLNGNEYDFQTKVKSNMTLKANWQVIHTVNITLDNQVYSVKVLDSHLATISDFNLPEKEGYTIQILDTNGEEFDFSKNIVTDLNLNANYKALQKYAITFDSNGGSKVNSIEAWENSTITEPVSTRKKYKLDGWYNGDVPFDFNTPITSNLKLKAQWTEEGKVKVTFIVDEKIYKTTSIKENTTVTKPESPSKKGNVFVEWQLNGQTYNFNNSVTSNITLVASFREAQTYKVTFNYNNGTSNKEIDVEEGTKVSKPATPIKKGYEFKGWLLKDKIFNFDNVITEDIILIANWEKESIKYEVTFNSTGGSDVKKQNIVQNNKATKPENPIRSGYKFLEWQLDGETYDFNTPVTKNITLEAIWRVLQNFVVKFDSDGGDSVPSQNIREDSFAVYPMTITKPGSTFVEWQLNGEKYDFNTPVTGNITLKALWQPNS